MRRISLASLVQATGAKILCPSQTQSTELAARVFEGIATDTRKPMSEEIFWALKGEKFDGHDFLSKAIEQGATGLLVQTSKIKSSAIMEWQKIAPALVVLGVEDSLKALQNLAFWIRKKEGYRVIGITGSNGKTTTKEFTRALLDHHYRVHANTGSFNNHFGLPFTILSAPESTEILVAEMGMNHAGEITELVKIGEPDVVVCTMVGTAHIENFGSQEGIAKAKQEIYEAAQDYAARIYNLDNPFCFEMFKTALIHVAKKKWSPELGVFFSQEPQQSLNHKFASFRDKIKSSVGDFDLSGLPEELLKKLEADAVCLQVKELRLGELKIAGVIGGCVGEATVPVFGKQNLTNLMAAAALALKCGVTPDRIWQNFPRCQASWGRNQIVKTARGATLLFDAYNANPESVQALLENVKEVDGFKRKFAALANMAELGVMSHEAHQKIGKLARQAGFEKVWFYGAHYEDFQKGFSSEENILPQSGRLSLASELSEQVLTQWATELDSELSDGDLLILKGSRSQKMERLLQSLGLSIE